MKKKALMVTLSMAMVLGVAGAVSGATTMGGNTTDMQPRTTYAQDYMDNNDVTSTEVEQVETSQPDQTVPSKTDIYDQMMDSNVSMTKQVENMPIDAHVENMPINTQMQDMPMNTQMNDQMSNSQHIQGMAETHTPDNSNDSHQLGQKSSGNNMMGSMGRMGR